GVLKSKNRLTKNPILNRFFQPFRGGQFDPIPGKSAMRFSSLPMVSSVYSVSSCRSQPRDRPPILGNCRLLLPTQTLPGARFQQPSVRAHAPAVCGWLHPCSSVDRVLCLRAFHPL